VGALVGLLLRRFRGSGALLLAVLVSACASAPDNIIGVDNPALPAADVAGVAKQTVYIVTTRQFAEDPSVLFGSDREPVGQNFARVDVTIPPNRDIGKVARPKSLPPDPRKDFVILNPVVHEGPIPFQQDLDRALANKPSDQREVMLFVHGYNTDLPAAIMRTAQLAHDSGFEGVPILFTWASRAKAIGYVYDLNSALHARDNLIESAELIATTRATGLNIIAHSMGNLLTVEAMRQDQLIGGFNNTGKIRTIVLASPDIDAELFVKQIRPFPRTARKFYVLISEDDKALAVSRKIAGGIDRVGDESASELAKLGVTVIDVTKIENTSSLNHSKFAESPEIVQLIGKRMNEGNTLETQNIRGLVGNLPAAASLLTGQGQDILGF
jgi:esterase/lipase superfamily enzyme